MTPKSSVVTVLLRIEIEIDNVKTQLSSMYFLFSLNKVKTCF